MASQLVSKDSLKLWFGWVVANTIDGAISAWLVIDSLLKTPGSNLDLFLSIAAFSLSISLCQGIFLRGKISKILEWIVGSFLSILCSPLLIVLFLSDYGIFMGFSIGLGIGFAQWFFALRKIPRSVLWIVFSSFGWGIGLVVGFAATFSSLEPITVGAIITFIYSAVTGIVLVQLLQREHQRNLSN